MKRIIYILLILLIFSSCEEQQIIEPDLYNKELKDHENLSQDSKNIMAGVYSVVKSVDYFGDTVVVKFCRDKMMIFTGKDYAHFILNSAIVDSVINFKGYWKKTNSYDRSYDTEITVPGDITNRLIITGEKPAEIKLSGYFSKNCCDTVYFEFKFSREILADQDEFHIVAHKGGGNNNTCFDAPENSIEILSISEYYGAEAVEVDVQLTKDKVPVVFHDLNFSHATVNTDFILGPVSSFYFEHIRNLASLKNGEKIPTAEEIFDYILYHTELKFVWMDIKTGETVPEIVGIQKKYNDLAKQTGRDLAIFMGIPSDEIYNELIKLEDFRSIPTLCELSKGKAKEIGAKYWAPRWTLGTLENDIEEMKNAGIESIFWTVNDDDAMDIILDKSGAAGILTDYPAILSYKHYVRTN